MDDLVRVFKTSSKFDDSKPWWDAHSMSMTEFCNNNKLLPIRLSVYNYVNSGNHPLYGSVDTTTREIEMLPNGELKIKNLKGQVTGTIKINQFKMDMRPSLVQYLKNKWFINLSIAIDFTLSNLEISDYRSLHKLSNKGQMN